MSPDPLVHLIRRAGDQWVALWPKDVSCTEHTAAAVRAHIAAVLDAEEEHFGHMPYAEGEVAVRTIDHLRAALLGTGEAPT